MVEAAVQTCKPQDSACRVLDPCGGQAAAAVLLCGAPRLAAAGAVHAVGPARERRPPAACMRAMHKHP